MARKIELGSPSFLKVAIVALIEGAFANAKFPIKAVITNNMPRDISLPDIGVFLRHVCNPDGENRREVELQNIDQLQRLASNIGQISMLNDYQYAAMTVEEVADELEQDPDSDGDDEAEAVAEAARIQAELDAAAEIAKAEAEAEAARVQAELDAAAEKAKAEADNDPDLNGSGDETGAGGETETDPELTGSGEGATDDSDPEKDAKPDVPEKKAAKTKKGEGK